MLECHCASFLACGLLISEVVVFNIRNIPVTIFMRYSHNINFTGITRTAKMELVDYSCFDRQPVCSLYSSRKALASAALHIVDCSLKHVHKLQPATPRLYNLDVHAKG